MLRCGRHQAHAGRRHHAQRPLAAAEQSPEVVSGVVLHESPHVRDGLAGPEHGLTTQELRPRGAMAEHLEPPGVGGDGAPDRRALTAAEIDAVRPPGSFCGHLHVGHRRPGAGGELAAQRVHIADPGQPPQTQHDLAFERDAPAHQARVAPLGDEGRTGVSADLDHSRHLPAVAGPDHGRRCTDETAGPVDAVRRHHVGLDDELPRSHDVAELLQHTRRHSSILARGAPTPSRDARWRRAPVESASRDQPTGISPPGSHSTDRVRTLRLEWRGWADPLRSRSPRASLRPAMARINETRGPESSGPSPDVQSQSVARRRRPAIRRFDPIRMFVFL